MDVMGINQMIVSIFTFELMKMTNLGKLLQISIILNIKRGKYNDMLCDDKWEENLEVPDDFDLPLCQLYMDKLPERLVGK